MSESIEKNCSQCKVNCMFSAYNHETGQSAYHYKREITFRKGETIFKQGTFLSNIIVVKEGLIKTFIEGSGGKDFIIRFYGPAEYLGLTQIFGKNENRYTAEVINKTTICMIEINYLKKLLANYPVLKESVFSHFSEEHDFLYRRLGILGTRNLQGRLAEAILYLCEKKLADLEIFNHITRKDLAELSAMSVESMIRLLNEFKGDKLIEIQGKKIRINNYETMKALGRVG